ncbi:MAG: hypothetical protein K2O97_06295 [Acetatifactor sp.]|nr:hypothetical protein [Acetatifactor sp.]
MWKRYKTGLLSIAALILLGGCGKTTDMTKEESSTVQESVDASSSEKEESMSRIAFEGQDVEGNVVSSEIFSE